MPERVLPADGLASLERGLGIIFALDQHAEGLSTADLAQAAGIPRSTVYRYLSVLERYGLVSPAATGGGAPVRYVLGNRFIALASHVPVEHELVKRALPLIVELSNRIGETVIITQVTGLQAICIERVESPGRVRLSFEKGAVLPLHAGASARVLMAYMTDAEVQEVIDRVGLARYTDNTITDPDELRRVLAETRARGYAISDEEMDPGVRAIAAPVLDRTGRARAAISVVGPRFRLDEAKTAMVLSLLLPIRDQLSAELSETAAALEGGAAKDRQY